MSIPRYKKGEKVRLTVEGTVTRDIGDRSTMLTLTYTLPTGGDAHVAAFVDGETVTIERLAPAEGEPQPGQLWADATGAERYAYRKNGAVSLLDERGVGVPWRIIHTDLQLGPITCVRPLPDADGPQSDTDQPREPRLMLDDVWEDRVGDIWRVVADATAVGGLRLMLVRNGGLITWADVSSSSGPLVLLERAGWRRTICTRPAERLRSGTVVSHPDWDDDAPVRLLTVQALTADGKTEVTYESLGDGAVGTGTAARDASVILWEPVGGAR